MPTRTHPVAKRTTTHTAAIVPERYVSFDEFNEHGARYPDDGGKKGSELVQELPKSAISAVTQGDAFHPVIVRERVAVDITEGDKFIIAEFDNGDRKVLDFVYGYGNNKNESVRIDCVLHGKNPKYLENQREMVLRDTFEKRVYRKKETLPFPDLPADHSRNRTKKQVNLRLPPDLLERVDEQCAAEGMDRTSWIERALETMLELGPPSPRPPER
jgi:hypothetical protein